MQRVPMTIAGASALQKELDKLKFKDRPEVIEAIATARELGDLKENAEYHAARERQSFLEGRIIELESKLSNVQLIDITAMKNNGKVVFGATVTLCNIDDDSEVSYQIVGDDEADIKESKISCGSPIARAIIGKSVGEEISVNTPSGEIEYEILSVEYI
jgi:transcription elongation factor GreA